MRVISKRRIREFAAKHPDAAGPVEVWYRITKAARWTSLVDVRQDLRSADVVGRRTIFNIKGNDYRMVARINYDKQRVYILKILTHAEYSRTEV